MNKGELPTCNSCTIGKMGTVYFERILFDTSSIRKPEKVKKKVNKVHKPNWIIMVDEANGFKITVF